MIVINVEVNMLDVGEEVFLKKYWMIDWEISKVV